MAKRTNGEGSAKWVVKNGVKYWRITITTGYDPLTGKQLRKDIYGKTQKEAKEKLLEFVGNDQYLNFLLDRISYVKKDYDLSKSIIYVKESDLGLKDKIIEIYGNDVSVLASDEIKIGGFILENKTEQLLIDESLYFALDNQKDWFYKTSGLMIK